MREQYDYVKTGEDNSESQRDLLKIKCVMTYAGGATHEHSSQAYEDYAEAGVVRWCSNGRCVPLEICESMQWYNMEAQRAAHEAELDALFTRMRTAQAEFDARTDPEAEAIRAEQAFERRAAFGPDVEVVNAITGKRYRT